MLRKHQFLAHLLFLVSGSEFARAKSGSFPSGGNCHLCLFWLSQIADGIKYPLLKDRIRCLSFLLAG